MNLATETLTNCFGQKITVFSEDHIGKHIRQFGLYEKEKLLFLLALLGKMEKPVVLDIGANIGNHSLAFATGAARILAFEPIPAIYSVLEQNLRQNHLVNVQAYNMALSDKDAVATIYLGSNSNLGMSSFDQRESATESIEVNCQIGDSFLGTLDLPKIDLIKIDVEGHEKFVVRGLLDTIKKHQPVITMEWNDPLAIEGFIDSPELEFLNEAYCFFGLGTNHDRTVWQDQPFALLHRKINRWFKPRKAVLHKFNLQWKYDNILLVPRGQLALLDLLN